MENLKLITHNVFKSDTSNFLSVINFGFEKGGKISYLTKDGQQFKTKQEIENNCTKVKELNDIDFKSSLYHWYKSNPKAYDKPINIDFNITTGEVYRERCWVFPLLIEQTETTIKIKPIFD